jgi:membrane protease subunit (stomatin/prohibitin family)
MFTNSMGYDQDRRPAKRPRDNGGESAHPNLNLNALENVGMGMGMGMTAAGDSLKNTREGRQQQQQQVSTSPTTTTMNRGRTDDKNNRKLSCKECRRQVLMFFLIKSLV